MKRWPGRAATSAPNRSCPKPCSPGRRPSVSSTCSTASTCCVPNVTSSRLRLGSGASAATSRRTSTSSERVGTTSPGRASTMPRDTCAVSKPARFTATRCPAAACATGLPCTCSPRTRQVPPPGSSATSSSTLTLPDSSVPVTTQPKPLVVKARSRGRKSGPSAPRSGSRAATSSRVALSASRPCPVLADTVTSGAPLKTVPTARLRRSASSSSSHPSPSPGSRSALVTTSTPWRTPSSVQMSTCSRVCGITPSSAATTSRATSMPPAPAAMALTKRSWPGTSTTPTTRPEGSARCAKPSSRVMPRRFSSGRRSVSTPVRAFTNDVLPWSTWPAVPTIIRPRRCRGRRCSRRWCPGSPRGRR